MTKKQYSLVLSLAALLSACASGPTGLESPKHPYDFRGYDGPDAAAASMGEAVKALDEKLRKCFADPPTKLCRNAITGELRGYIDDYWRRFKSDFSGRAGLTNVLFDGTTQTLAAAALITTPKNARDIMTALVTSLLAFRTSMQKNLMGDQNAYGLLGQMDSDRLIIARRIDTETEKNIDDYSLNRAMSDLAEYADTMSVASAIISMQRAGAANAQKIKDQEVELLVQTSRRQAAAAADAAAKLEASAAGNRLKAAQDAASATALERASAATPAASAASSSASAARK